MTGYINDLILARKQAADLKVGMEMELTTMPLFTDDDGVERIVYAWRIA